MEELLDIPLANQNPNDQTPITNPPAGGPNPSVQITQPVDVSVVSASPTQQNPANNQPLATNNQQQVVTGQATQSSPPTAQSSIPSIDQMEQSLQQSGKLLNEVSTKTDQQADDSPLSALQPQNMLKTEQGPQPMIIKSDHEQKLNEIQLATTHKAAGIDNIASTTKVQLLKYMKIIVAIALTIQGLYGIFHSIKFILVDYPALETQLLSHQITRTEVNNYATKAIITLFTTILGMFFALKIMRNKATKMLNTFIGIGLFFGSAYLQNYLSNHYDLTTLLTNPLVSVIDGIRKIPDTIISWIPYLERNSTGEIEVVWYK